MNDFIIYINGQLMPSGLFTVRQQTSALLGRFQQLIGSHEEVKKACSEFDKLVRIDMMEVRSSNIIKRYEYVKPDDGKDDHFLRMPPNKETGEPARVQFRLLGLPNSF